MNNNTKIRLHLSKNLFESIAKEVLTEAKKANDGYTVAVKQPKQPKQSKSQAASPEVQKTDAETKMEAAPAQTATTGTLAKDLRQKAQSVLSQPGISAKEVQGIQKLIDTILSKASSGELAVAIDKAQRVIDMSTKNMDASEKAPVAAKPTAAPAMKEMETRVAEEDQLDEFTGTETEMSGVYTVLGTLLGMGIPLVTALVKDLKKAKTPEEKKQVLQSMASQIDKSKGVQEGDKALKEYEQHYEVRNGECRRYNDEGEYTVVSMHYCR